MSEKVQLTHPQGKKLASIDRDKYEVIRNAILKSLDLKDALTHKELYAAVEDYIRSRQIPFDGSIEWYMEGVKLDLEAKDILNRKKEKQRLLFALKDSKA